MRLLDLLQLLTGRPTNVRILTNVLVAFLAARRLRSGDRRSALAMLVSILVGRTVVPALARRLQSSTSAAAAAAPTTVLYSEFRRRVAAGEVATALLSPESIAFAGKASAASAAARGGGGGGGGPLRMLTPRLPDTELLSFLEAHKVSFGVAATPLWRRVLPALVVRTMLLVLLLVLLLMLLLLIRCRCRSCTWAWRRTCSRAPARLGRR